MAELTERQLEIVCHLANGYRMAEIVELMHFSRSSLETTLKRARKRASARTNPHLVSICIATGQLWWDPNDKIRYIHENGGGDR